MTLCSSGMLSPGCSHSDFALSYSPVSFHLPGVTLLTCTAMQGDKASRYSELMLLEKLEIDFSKSQMLEQNMFNNVYLICAFLNRS